MNYSSLPFQPHAPWDPNIGHSMGWNEPGYEYPPYLISKMEIVSLHHTMMTKNYESFRIVFNKVLKGIVFLEHTHGTEEGNFPHQDTNSESGYQLEVDLEPNQGYKHLPSYTISIIGIIHDNFKNYINGIGWLPETGGDDEEEDYLDRMDIINKIVTLKWMNLTTTDNQAYYWMFYTGLLEKGDNNLVPIP